MIRMLTAAAAVALLAGPALAQDVSAGGKASIDQERTTPLTERSDSEFLERQSPERQDQSQVQDQTAEMPGEDSDVSAAPGQPEAGSNLGQTDQLDQDQTSRQAEELLPPIEEEGETAQIPAMEDDQTAQVPGQAEGQVTDEDLERSQEQDQEKTGEGRTR